MTRQYFAPDKDLLEKAEKDAIIYDPRETGVDPSKMEGIFGAIFPAGIVLAPQFLAGAFAMYYVFVMLMIFVAMATAPLRAESAEHAKKGTPVRILHQVGKYIQDYATRFFTPRLLVRPEWRPDPDDESKMIQGLKFSDFCQTTDNGRFTTKDKDGDVIVTGTWLIDEEVDKQHQDMLKRSDSTKDGTPRKTIFSTLITRLTNMKKSLAIAVILAGALWIFLPRISTLIHWILTVGGGW